MTDPDEAACRGVGSRTELVEVQERLALLAKLATRVYLYAVILASMIPERHDAIFERAADYAHNRLVCGVHYASDVDAGRILGTVMGVLIERNPLFMRQFSAVRKEARQILAARNAH